MASQAADHKKGYTLVELLLSIALMAILTTGATSVSVYYVMSVNVNTTISNVETAIETARDYTLDHYKGNSNYGIFVSASKLIVYAGTVYTGSNIIYYTVTNPVGVQFSSINFNSLTYVSFASVTGLPSNSGSFKITSSFKTKTIQINAGGIVGVS